MSATAARENTPEEPWTTPDETPEAVPAASGPGRAIGTLVLAILLTGAVIRVGLFVSPHALWADEAKVALNLLDRDYAQLTSRLDHDQYAPVGFLVVTKFVCNTIGYTEQAFRFLPFVCGMVFPVVMWLWARRQSSDAGMVAVVALASFGPPLISYSNQLKPYELDALATALILLMYALRPEHVGSWGAEAGKGLLASVLLLFSFPMVFCMSGISAARLGIALGEKRRQDSGRIVAGTIPWVLTAGLYFVLFLSNASRDSYLQDFWAGSFLAFPRSPFVVRRDVDLLLRAVGPTIGLDASLAAVLVTCGALHGLAVSRHRRLLAMLLAILGFAAAASAMQRWPFDIRLLLFGAPIALTLAGWAVDFICARHGWRVRGAVIASVLLGPVSGAYAFTQSVGVEDGLKHVSRILQGEFRPGDLVYVYYLAEPEEAVYRRLGVFPNVAVITSTDLIKAGWPDCQRQIAMLDPNARVWVIFGNVRKFPFDERQAMLAELARHRQETRRIAPYLSLFAPARAESAPPLVR